MHRQEGCSAPGEDWIAAEVPGQSLSMCHPSVPWGSHGFGATLAHVLMSHMCSWGIAETSNGTTSGYAQNTSGALELLHVCSIPCIVCAMNCFLPFLYSLGEPLSYLHKITFGKYLPFFASMAKLHMSISVSSRVVALKDRLCQDSVRVLQG